MRGRGKIAVFILGLWATVQAADRRSTAPLFALTTSFGQRLDTQNPNPSLSIEPSLGTAIGERTTLRFRAIADKPLNPHEPVAFPTAEALASFEMAPSRLAHWAVFSQMAAKNLEGWGFDGPNGKVAIGGQLRAELTSWLQVEAMAAPYVGLHHFATQADGKPHSHAGLSEQLALTLRRGRAQLELVALFTQDFDGTWANLFSSFERLSITLTQNLAVGVSHQLVSSAVGVETGAHEPIGLFDSRKSRLAGFVQWRL